MPKKRKLRNARKPTPRKRAKTSPRRKKSPQRKISARKKVAQSRKLPKNRAKLQKRVRRPVARYRVTKSFKDKTKRNDTETYVTTTKVIKPTKGRKRRVSSNGIRFIKDKFSKLDHKGRYAVSIERQYTGRDGKRKTRWDNIDAENLEQLNTFLDSMVKITYDHIENKKVVASYELEGGTIDQIRISETKITKTKRKTRKSGDL